MTATALPQNPADVRQLIRTGAWRGVTSGVAPGHVQANLAILPRELAFDFLLFCQRNPKPCPLLEVIEAGSVEPTLTAPGADIRTDFPGYRIYEEGTVLGGGTVAGRNTGPMTWCRSCWDAASPSSRQ